MKEAVEKKSKVRPIIGRTGGKVRMAPKIIKHLMRFEWSLYCEPFCGSAAVYFRMIQDGIDQQIRDRKHHPRFVLNDADSRIVNLFRVCRDHATELALAAYFTPYSREEHRLAQLPQGGLSEVERDLIELTNTSKNILTSNTAIQQFRKANLQTEKEDLIETARQYLVSGWQSFASKHGNNFGIAKNTDRAVVRQCPSTNYSTIPDRILSAILALKSCYIENDDAIKVIERWSCSHCAIYADPPYIGKEKYYDYKWTAEDHQKLAKLLNNVLAACVIVSYYDCPELDDLYPADKWERHYYDTVTTSSPMTKQSKTRIRPKRTEMILVRKL